MATKRILIFACFLFPFHNITCPVPRKKPQPLIRLIIMNSLKVFSPNGAFFAFQLNFFQLSLELSKMILFRLDNVVQLRSITREMWKTHPTKENLVKLGRTMRSMEDKWKEVFGCYYLLITLVLIHI